MHKGIRLIVKLWIEGEDQPAHDFAAYSMQAVKEILSSGPAPGTFHPALQITVRSIEEDTDWEESETRPD